jgi:hypothetical protein
VTAMPMHDAHRRNRAKNVALAVALLGWCALIFLVSLYKFGFFK